VWWHVREHRGPHLPGQLVRRGFQIGSRRWEDRRVVDDGDAPRSWQEPVGRPGRVPSHDGDREHRDAQRGGQPEGAGLEGLKPAVGGAPALGKDHHGGSGLKEPYRLPGGPGICRFDLHRKGADPPDQPTEPRHLEEPAPGHVVDRAAHRDGNEQRVSVGDVVRSDDQRSAEGNMLDALVPDPEVRPRDEPTERAEEVLKARTHASIVTQP